MNITLVGLTKKGKQRIKEHGAHWRVVKKLDKVNFSTEPGPWILVTPSNRSDDCDASRWIHQLSDKDFKLMPFAALENNT